MPQAEREPSAVTHPTGRLRTVLAFVLLSMVAAGCFSLGLWQLGRAAERDALHDAIERGRLQAPLTLSASSAPADLMPWRAAQARGRWLSQHTVLLENRNLEGRPGYWVATPLQLEPAPIPPNRHDAITAGSAEIGAVAGGLTGNEEHGADFLSRGPGAGTVAVLVLRGWLPRDMQAGSALPEVPAEPGMVEIRGELHAHVPRIFELWQWAGGRSSQLPSMLPQPDGGIPLVQNLVLGDLARASGLQLLPAVLAQTHDSAMLEHNAASVNDGLRREWPGPSLDSDQNKGYALQWFSFSALAAIAALFMMRGLLRRGPQRKKQQGTPHDRR